MFTKKKSGHVGVDPVSVLLTIQILKTSQENINHSWGVALNFDYFHLPAYAVESDNINHSSSSFLFYFMFFNFLSN